MEYKLKATGQRNLAITIIILLLMSILSLGLCYRMYSDNRALTAALVNNRQTIIQPLIANGEFAFNGERGDARYLRLMALSLMDLRLNISRETMQASHDLLLAYASVELREKLLPVLADERKRISINDGSSVFYPKEFRVLADRGIVDITGNLQFTYGMQPAEPVKKRYRLRIDTRNDGMHLNAFVEVPVEN